MGLINCWFFYAAFGMSVGETPLATRTHNGQILGISSGNGGFGDAKALWVAKRMMPSSATLIRSLTKTSPAPVPALSRKRPVPAYFILYQHTAPSRAALAWSPEAKRMVLFNDRTLSRRIGGGWRIFVRWKRDDESMTKIIFVSDFAD
jgi:hypothetical protein